MKSSVVFKVTTETPYIWCNIHQVTIIADFSRMKDKKHEIMNHQDCLEKNGLSVPLSGPHLKDNIKNLSQLISEYEYEDLNNLLKVVRITTDSYIGDNTERLIR